MLRIIPRLDVKGPNVVKGTQLDCYRVVGRPEVLAKTYYEQGADELIFMDTVASLYERPFDPKIVRKTAQDVFIPMTVGGGIRSTDDMREVLRAGADKVAINTAAVANPGLLTEGARMFGSQCIVASLEVQRHDNGFLEVWIDNGRQRTGLDARAWAKEVVKRGAGEILLTSINREGTGRGFDIDLICEISNLVSVPVIASGGASSKEDVAKLARTQATNAISAASLFHYKYGWDLLDTISMTQRYKIRADDQTDTGNVDFMHVGYGHQKAVPVEPISIPELKTYLKSSGLSVRGNVI